MARILIMDDDRMDLVSCERFFQQQGDAVEVATNADEGISRAKSGDFDVVMIDLYWDLPGNRAVKTRPKGLDLLGRLHHDDPILPIIVITAFPTLETSLTARKLGAYDYLSKPPTDEWANAVHTAAACRAKLTLGQQIARVGGTPLNVLVQGPADAGTWVARLLQHHSPRRDQPWAMVNCSDSQSFVEGELFAVFQNDDHPQIGAFQEANGGTIILLEVGELSRTLQGRLRSMLEDPAIRPAGWKEKRDVRIIATTERELSAARFRPDLYHRISEAIIRIPN